MHHLPAVCPPNMPGTKGNGSPAFLSSKPDEVTFNCLLIYSGWWSLKNEGGRIEGINSSQSFENYSHPMPKSSWIYQLESISLFVSIKVDSKIIVKLYFVISQIQANYKKSTFACSHF